MELGAKDFFMVISLLKLLQIYCTKHIIVVLDSKAKKSSLHTKVLSNNKCWRVRTILIFFLITVKSQVPTHLTHLEAHAGFFKLLMNGIFYPYVLLPFD